VDRNRRAPQNQMRMTALFDLVRARQIFDHNMIDPLQKAKDQNWHC
jgi:hypothetical protein